jgi:hypothetical protein
MIFPSLILPKLAAPHLSAYFAIRLVSRKIALAEISRGAHRLSAQIAEYSPLRLQRKSVLWQNAP